MGPAYVPGPVLGPFCALLHLRCTRTAEGGYHYCLHPTSRDAEVQTKANSVKVTQPVVDRARIWTQTAWSPSLCSPALHYLGVMTRSKCHLQRNEPSVRRDEVGTNTGLCQRARPSGFGQSIMETPSGAPPWLFAWALSGGDRRGQSITG